MTFTAVGSNFSANSVTTFTLTPAGVGHLILLEIEVGGGTTVWCTNVASSNVTWAQMGTLFTGTTNARATVVFAGRVTAASAATVTLTFNGTPGGSTHAVGQEFSSTVGSWALDVQGNLDSAGTATWVSLTPAGSGELYWGYATDAGAALAGSTSGYTYVANSDTASNGMAYNPSCGAGATAPAWGDSGQAFGIMVLVKETGGAPAPFFPARQPSRSRVPQPYTLGRPGLLYANSVHQVP